MKKLLLLTSILVLTLLTWAYAINTADSVGKIPYQGFLADISGNPVLDGDYDMVFTIYDDSTGGTVLWTEMQMVSVTNGGFSVMLGSETPIPDSALSFPTQNPGDGSYLGITVNTDSEMSPRTELGGPPYAGFAHAVSGHITTQPGLMRVSTIDGIISGDVSVDSSGANILLKSAPPPSSDRDTTLLAITADTSKAEIILGYVTDGSARDTTLLISSDVDGGHISFPSRGGWHDVDISAEGISWVDDLDTTVSITSGADGPRLAMFPTENPQDSLIITGNGLTAFNTVDVLRTTPHSISFESDTNAYMSSMTAANMVILDTTDQSSTEITSTGISINDGAKGIVAGLSPQGLTLTTGAVSGYVLTVDGSGDGTWEEPTGGSGSSCWDCPGNYTFLVDSTDSVGIGISEPVDKLNVRGGTRLFPDPILDPWGYSYKGLVIAREEANSWGQTGIADSAGIYFSSGSDDYSLINSVHNGSETRMSILVGDDADDHLLLLPTGDVGVGTQTPTAKLDVDVSGTIGLRAAEFRNDYSSDPVGVACATVTIENVNTHGIALNASATTPDATVILGNQDATGKLIRGFGPSYFIKFEVTSDGKVGINKSTPTVELDVNGSGHITGNLDIDGTLSKGAGTFKIDHPLDPANKFLYHSFIESPDMMNVYNGNIVLDANGEAVVELPEYFDALNKDFRYQLTCVGGYAPVYIAEKIAGNTFVIGGGTSDLEISWQVTGVRKDAFAEANRVQAEVEKSDSEKGKYLHPEAFGLEKEAGISHVISSKLSGPAEELSGE